MTKAIIGKKIGMTQIFDEAGKVVPVTVIEAGPCVVVQKKTTENDGYEAVQLGFGDVTPKHLNKPEQGHFKKNDVAFKKTLKEFRLDDISAVNVGDVLKADVFAEGDVIDVAGVSKGKGIEQAVAGNRIGDISNAIQTHVEANGYAVCRKYIGHGIGREMHEDPEVPNFGRAGRGPRLCQGMTIAIEPMVNTNSPDNITLKDGWTVVTTDGSLSAHFENTVAITDGAPIILTQPEH